MKLYPEAEGTFTFTDRDNTEYDKTFLEELKIELAKLSNLRLIREEFNWCVKHISYIPEIYWEWLSQFEFDLPLITNVFKVYLDERRLFKNST